MDLKKSVEFLDSKEGEQSIIDFFKKIEKSKETLTLQLEKFNKLFSTTSKFEMFVEKVIEKYNSDQYYYRWMNRGIEPPEDLYWFLYSYSQKYGRKCTKQERKKYGNMFTSELYFINGFYISRMDGQGSVIQITK
mgnify:CR=1 FL=1